MLDFLIENYQIVSVLLNVAIIPALGFIVKWLILWKKENDAREWERQQMEKAHHKGTIALLRDRIIQSGMFFSSKGGIPSRVKDNLLDMYDAYHTLGGNGSASEVIDEVKRLPVDDNILKKGTGQNE